MAPQRFEVPAMSTTLVVTIVVAFAVPAMIIALAYFTAAPGLGWVAAFLVVLYAGVWLWFRPSHYEVVPGELRIGFPLRTRRVALQPLREVEVVSGTALKARLGWVVRVGVGGLYGVFGLLRTSRAGWIDVYLTRLDQNVWLDAGSGRPLLLSVADRERFVRAVRG